MAERPQHAPSLVDTSGTPRAGDQETEALSLHDEPGPPAL